MKSVAHTRAWKHHRRLFKYATRLRDWVRARSDSYQMPDTKYIVKHDKTGAWVCDPETVMIIKGLTAG